MEALLQDVRYAAQTLIKSPGLTAVIVLTLGLGIGGMTGIFSTVNVLLLRSLPGVEEPERLVAVYTSDFSSGLYGGSSYPDYVDYRDRATAFSSLAAFTAFTPDVNLSAGADAERIGIVAVSGNYFDTLGVEAALGRSLLRSDDEVAGGSAVAVLSHALWQQRFGAAPGVVGSTIRLNGRAFTVVGVAPADFHGTQLAAPPEAWIPLSMIGLVVDDDILEQRGSRWLGVVGRRAPGASIDQATAQIETIAAELADAFPETNRGTLQDPDRARPMTLVPASEAMIDPAERGIVVRVASLLVAGALLLLLVGCANLASLELARGTSRVHEIALRFSLGASRPRLMFQMLVRSTLLALGGGLAGVLLALALVELILASNFVASWIAVDAVPARVLDYGLLAFALLLSLGVGMLFGLAPALQASRTEPAARMKSGASRSATHAGSLRFRNFLVVGQVALALVLLIGAGLLGESLRSMLAVDRGYTLERALIAEIELPSEDYSDLAGLALLDMLKERLESHRDVRAASYAWVVPVSSVGRRRLVAVDGYVPQPGEDLELNHNIVDADYFGTMGIALLSGRGFLTTDRGSSAAVAVVNETFARRYYGGADPVGRVFRNGGRSGDPVEIVGMVRDGKYRSLRETPLPYIYFPLSQNYSPDVSIVVGTTTDPLSLAPWVRDEIRRLDPRMPLSGVRTLQQHLSGLVATEQTVSGVSLAFGVLAMLLAMLGIYGLLTFLVAERTREFGTRLALGATTGSLLRLVLGRGAVLTLIGLSIGIAAALALTRALSAILHGVSATEPAIFVVMALILLTATMLSSYLPARRATKVNPIVALREQ